MAAQTQRDKAKAEGTAKRRTKRTAEQREMGKKFLKGMVSDSEYQVHHSCPHTCQLLCPAASAACWTMHCWLAHSPARHLMHGPVQGEDYEVFSTWLGSTQAA